MNTNNSEVPCPVCGKSMQANPRYPNAVCGSCSGMAADENGRRLGFSNVDIAGGLIAYYLDTDEPYDSHECFVNDMRCWAEEARFGGVVIQVAAEP